MVGPHRNFSAAGRKQSRQIFDIFIELFIEPLFYFYALDYAWFVFCALPYDTLSLFAHEFKLPNFWDLFKFQEGRHNAAFLLSNLEYKAITEIQSNIRGVGFALWWKIATIKEHTSGLYMQAIESVHEIYVLPVT